MKTGLRIVLTAAVYIATVKCGGVSPGSGGTFQAMPFRSVGGGDQEAVASNPITQARNSSILLSAASQDLLYVADLSRVRIFSYPAGRDKGKLTGFYFATGACVDQSGNVYITDQGQHAVFEYAHGGMKRLRTLHPGLAFGCSIDPMTGNLAVADGATGPTGRGTAGNLAIYLSARGKPKYYRDSAFHFYYFCGYDNQGNLFMDGDATAEPYSVVFAELPRGGSKLETITLNHSLGYAGGVQWDGTNVAITDPHANAVYQFAINGSQAALVGTTPLNGTNSIIQPWIQGQKIIVPNALVPGGNVLIYKYPAGGAPIKKITSGRWVEPQGATISKAPS